MEEEKRGFDGQNLAGYLSNREVKSSAFTAFFSTPENAARLYSALDGIDEVRPEDIEFRTLQGVLFLARKNDMAFTVKNRVLVISEHQSTLNANMPLRDAIYYGRTMEKLIPPKSLYKERRIGIPTPEFYVFYNGHRNFPAEQILKLSDAYLEKPMDPMLELKVKVININLPVKHPILEHCRPLYEYSWFIDRIRTYVNGGLNRDAAIIQAVNDCKKACIMADFMNEHGSEAVNMIFTQFNMEDALEVHGEEMYEEGLEAGRSQGITEGKLEGKLEGKREGKTEQFVAVVRKLLRSLDIPQIAAVLEIPQEKVEQLAEWIADYPALDDGQLAEKLLSKDF